jgi:hypothetical protein
MEKDFVVIGVCGAFECILAGFDSLGDAEAYRDRVWARVGGEFDNIFVNDCR